MSLWHSSQIYVFRSGLSNPCLTTSNFGPADRELRRFPPLAAFRNHTWVSRDIFDFWHSISAVYSPILCYLKPNTDSPPWMSSCRDSLQCSWEILVDAKVTYEIGCWLESFEWTRILSLVQTRFSPFSVPVEGRYKFPNGPQLWRPEFRDSPRISWQLYAPNFLEISNFYPRFSWYATVRK